MKYDTQRIAYELTETALGNSYYGNALRVAKDLPELTQEDRSVLDRYATGIQTHTDSRSLQEIASKIKATIPVSAIPINKSYVFEDAPDPDLAQAWRDMADAENDLADALADQPERTIVHTSNNAWFLRVQDGERVLCHINSENALSWDDINEEAESRFDIGLDWVDISKEDLEGYTSDVSVATKEFKTVVIPDNPTHAESQAGKNRP